MAGTNGSAGLQGIDVINAMNAYTNPNMTIFEHLHFVQCPLLVLLT